MGSDVVQGQRDAGALGHIFLVVPALWHQLPCPLVRVSDRQLLARLSATVLYSYKQRTTMVVPAACWLCARAPAAASALKGPQLAQQGCAAGAPPECTNLGS